MKNAPPSSLTQGGHSPRKPLEQKPEIERTAMTYIMAATEKPTPEVN
jgi:hypothetical protein